MNDIVVATDNLSEEFHRIVTSSSEWTIDCVEIGLDSIMDDGIVKDIPILSTITLIYKLGSDIHARHNLKKLAVFLQSIKNNLAGEQKRNDYYNKFKADKKFRNKELEYVLIILDRYIEYDKPSKLAKIYLAYINEEINWNEFVTYSQIIDSFLPGDYEVLKNGDFYSTNKKGLHRAR